MRGLETAGNSFAIGDPARKNPWRFAVYGMPLVGAPALIFVTPLHMAACVVCCALAILPVVAVTVIGVIQKGGPWPYEDTDEPPVRARFWAVFIMLTFPAGVLLLANQVFDGSPPEREVLPILAKSTGYDWADAETHEVTVQPREPSPLWRWDTGPETVRLSRNAWAQVVPGQSRLVLTVHKGLLGFPWYERGPSLDETR